MDKIEDDIEEDREGRSKDEMDEKFLIKTAPNCKNIAENKQESTREYHHQHAADHHNRL